MALARELGSGEGRQASPATAAELGAFDLPSWALGIAPDERHAARGGARRRGRCTAPSSSGIAYLPIVGCWHRAFADRLDGARMGPVDESIGRTTHRSAVPARQPIPASPTSQPDGSARSTPPMRWKIIFLAFPRRHLPTCRRMPTPSNDRRPPLARSADSHGRGRFSEHSPLDRSAVRTCPGAHLQRDSDARHPSPR